MIYNFTGQPHAGKTTLAEYLKEILEPHSLKQIFHIDGDNLRELLKNNYYNEAGRRNNIEKAYAIARYLDSLNYDVIISLVSPYADLREELKFSTKVIEIYVHTKDIRGREGFHVENYEKPVSKFIEIDTTETPVIASLNELLNKIENQEHNKTWKIKTNKI